MITTREEAVTKAVEMSRAAKNILLQWATGVGKSKAAIEIIRDFGEENKYFPTVLLIVAETAHKDNWYKEFEKWDALDIWQDVIVDCYASLKNHRNANNYDILVLDEGHHSGSEIRLDILRTIQTKQVIVLSATLKQDILEALEDIFGSFKTFNINLTNAIEQNLLPVPKIFLYELQLDNRKLNQTIVIERGKEGKKITIKCPFAKRWEYLKNKAVYPNLKLIISCTELEKYTHLSEQFEYYKKLYLNTRQEHLKNKWLRIGSERKRFLGEIKSKYVIHLLPQLRNKRYICFCASIEQAELLGGDSAIHSKNKDAQQIIRSFNDRKISNLFAVGMLQEGQNLVGIDAGIIVQLDGQERVFIQKFGRTLRSDSPEQHIFYYGNTRDEEYLNNALEDINPEYVQVINDFKSN